MIHNHDPRGGMELHFMNTIKKKVKKVEISSTYVTKFKTSLMMVTLLWMDIIRTRNKRLSRNHSHLMKNEKNQNKINYTCFNDDDVINMVEPIYFDYCNIITIRGKQDNTKPKTPVVLRGATSTTSDNEPLQYCANAIMHSHAKVVLKGLVPLDPNLEQHKDKPLTSPSSKGTKVTTSSRNSSYSILD